MHIFRTGPNGLNRIGLKVRIKFRPARQTKNFVIEDQLATFHDDAWTLLAINYSLPIKNIMATKRRLSCRPEFSYVANCHSFIVIKRIGENHTNQAT